MRKVHSVNTEPSPDVVVASPDARIQEDMCCYVGAMRLEVPPQETMGAAVES